MGLIWLKDDNLHMWNTKANPLEKSIYTLKHEGQEGKTGPLQGYISMGGGA
jgi:hypothetical protein